MICKPGLPRPILSLTFIFVSLLSLYFSLQENTSQSGSAEKQPHVPEYFIRDFTLRSMDHEGRLERKMQAQEMIRYLDDETTEVTSPHFMFYRPDQPPWDIRSKTGWLSGDGRVALLSGRVTVIRPASNGNLPFKMVTEDLRVLPRDNYIETDNDVDAKSGLSHIQATGLQAWLSEPGRMKFLSNVRGHYVAK